MQGWRGALVLGLVVAVLGGLFVYSGMPDEPGSHSASWRTLNSGIYEVGDIDYHLVDTTRPTSANGEFTGLDHREFDTRVWFPKVENAQVAPGRHPLLVYSHGFGSSKSGGAYLASHMARQGYVVLAVDYPLTSFGAPGGASLADVVNQPADISFLLDSMLGWDADPDSPFYQRIDAGRIAAIGTSLGGLTSTLVAYHPRWRDPRVELAVSIAGPLSMLAKQFFNGATADLLMVAATDDGLVDYASHAASVLAKVPRATLVSIKHGSHTGFSGLSRYVRWMDNPDAIACRYVRKRLLDNPQRANWQELLGGEEQGIDQDNGPMPCLGELPRVINPVLQQRITTLAVASYLQQKFASTAVEIAASRQYLFEVLPQEVPGVTVESNNGW
jgi:dienelactone hydrolase